MKKKFFKHSGKNDTIIQRRYYFLKLLKERGTLTAPEICSALKIEKHSDHSTDYAELSNYIQWPGWDEEFDNCFYVEHFDGDEATSSLSKFCINQSGIKWLHNKKRRLWLLLLFLIGTILA